MINTGTSQAESIPDIVAECCVRDSIQSPIAKFGKRLADFQELLQAAFNDRFELSPDGKTLTTATTVSIYDASGVLITTRCTTGSGTRVE